MSMSALIVGLILAVGSVICFVVMRTELRGQIDDQLRQQRRLIEQFVARTPVMPSEVPRFSTTSQDDAPYAQLIDAAGTATRPGTAGVALPVTAADLAVARGQRRELRTDRTVRGQHLRLMTFSIPGRRAVQLARPLKSVDNALASLRLVLALLIFGGLALAAVGSRLFARSVLSPIADLTDATEHIHETGDLGRRVNDDRTDEAGRLATSFNAMLSRVEDSQQALTDVMTSQRQLVADASHELRTPVASLRANIEILMAGGATNAADRRTLMADVVEQTEELSALVSDLIELARGDHPPGGQQELDIAEIAREATARAERHHPNLTHRSDIETWPMVGSPERLGRAINNLLDNAAKFSAPGATVELELRAGTLRIRDHGPGVSDNDLPHIFERFYRADDAGAFPGSGLGLAIVKQVVEAHGGAVSARNA
ncbi:MAG TPA: HAMP domain-containing sensor histidine kinase, partial [Baekduia sp.]|nr:HAMP domain-containing sensor histidine kinase [Baekduia sp.]